MTAAASIVWLSGSAAATADRAVIWTTSGEAALERELNAGAARGLRLAAVSDGLPCTVTAMQAPEATPSSLAYRVVADRDLDARLATLVADGFIPRLPHRRQAGRAHVVFERGGNERPATTWRTIEFADLNALPAALEAAAAEGYQPRLLARYPLRSWPGLSERGLILASRTAAAAREVRVVVGQSNRIDAAAKDVAAAAAAGFGLDLFFTGSRDGSPALRRERMVAVMSRASGATAPRAVTIEKSTSFGMFGSGEPLGAAPFWDDSYVYAFAPANRRQIWASPIRLSADEAMCGRVEWKLGADAPRDLTWSIVGLAARKLSTGGYELVYVTDQRQ